MTFTPEDFAEAARQFGIDPDINAPVTDLARSQEAIELAKVIAAKREAASTSVSEIDAQRQREEDILKAAAERKAEADHDAALAAAAREQLVAAGTPTEGLSDAEVLSYTGIRLDARYLTSEQRDALAGGDSLEANLQAVNDSVAASRAAKHPNQNNQPSLAEKRQRDAQRDAGLLEGDDAA